MGQEEEDEEGRIHDAVSGILEPVVDENKSEDPNKIVQKENLAVEILRYFFQFILMIAAAGAIVAVYRYSSNVQKEKFQVEYEAVSKAVLDSFLGDVTMKTYNGLALASLVGSHFEVKQTKPWTLDVPITRMLQGSAETRFFANSEFVAYSPFIFNQSDRQEFEDYAVSFEEQNGPFRAGFDLPCYSCGGPNYVITQPTKQVEIPGFGAFTCEFLLFNTEQGVANYDQCPFYEDLVGSQCGCVETSSLSGNSRWPITNGIFRIDEETGLPVAENTLPLPLGNVSRPLYSPIWQHAGGSLKSNPVLFNQMSLFNQTLMTVFHSHRPAMTKTFPRSSAYYTSIGGSDNQPGTIMHFPVSELDNRGRSVRVMGVITLEFLWSKFLTSIFPPSSKNIHVVIENSCDGNHTFRINTEFNLLDYVGPGDLHEKRFEHMQKSTQFDEFARIVILVGYSRANPPEVEDDICSYRFMTFPTQAMQEEFVTNEPVLYAVMAGSIFLFATLVFAAYDWLVVRRQKKIIDRATKTGGIVSSLFPQTVRERLYDQVDMTESAQSDGTIADFFPSCTVLFIDIENFTAWSSERGPEQVFKLLESLYAEFDSLAVKMGVFKVETIGDSFVAACGLPKPRENHSVVMALFAKYCLKRMAALVKRLETRLGPDTGDLRARCGLHSGPVTAGVLRGEKARFQLFGDTVNVSARLEATGKPHRIHASKEFVDCLQAQGYGDWFRPRDGMVNIKGRGEFQTFWVEPPNLDILANATDESSLCGDLIDENCTGAEQLGRSKQEKVDRMISWNVQLLLSLLKKVVAARRASNSAETERLERSNARTEEMLVIDELKHIIDFSDFNPAAALLKAEEIELDEKVENQMLHFVRKMAYLYRDVPFHNFEHASHVMMSAEKMMERIMKPEGIDYKLDGVKTRDKPIHIAKQIHDCTYGLSSESLMQFCVVFAALLHDIDHTGLTNKELIDIGSPLAAQYRETSVAEQNSLDIAWSILELSSFTELRNCIFATESEKTRFRDLLVNAIMATDIANKSLQKQRKDRWADAFSKHDLAHEARPTDPKHDRNRKATIVFEHIIQASDVSHTMQHWMTFRKFNARLFEERYIAWLKGVAGKEDPSVGWYKGEIGFFDFYIIPLARKLDQCGVFGVSYHEYLHHAEQNRNEWVRKGERITSEMLEACKKKYKSGLPSVVQGDGAAVKQEQEQTSVLPPTMPQPVVTPDAVAPQKLAEFGPPQARQSPVPNDSNQVDSRHITSRVA